VCIIKWQTFFGASPKTFDRMNQTISKQTKTYLAKPIERGTILDSNVKLLFLLAIALTIEIRFSGNLSVHHQMVNFFWGLSQNF
jgi:hypothetical protein